MTKEEMIDILVEGCGYGREDLEEYTEEDLKDMIDEISGDGGMYPNGRDYDSEDWD